MRLLTLIFIALVPVCTYAQKPPVDMGLWETTITVDLTATPEVASRLRAAGHKVPDSRTQTTRLCYNARDWPRVVDLLERAGNSCSAATVQTTAHGFTSAYSCAVGTTQMVYRVVGSWPSRILFSTSTTAVSHYANVSGESTIKTTASSRFVAASCESH
jgi:hypothetical protein